MQVNWLTYELTSCLQPAADDSSLYYCCQRKGRG